MISDSSSLIYQYTFTEKPVLALLGSSKNRSYYVFCDFYSNYFVEDGFSVQQFVRMVLNGEDPKKEERMMYAKKSVSNTDGTCGLKVHMAIKEKY